MTMNGYISRLLGKTPSSADIFMFLLYRRNQQGGWSNAIGY